ncbi:type IV secretory system conjugative DNA transfer family protein [Croceimicrobium sp.]|uniref:type IV secretory system conjugative DNA transfer family protein n=1 Tax=Croceimicrobium sp. TaxID=2828340 RepID=UPI003BACBA57
MLKFIFRFILLGLLVWLLSPVLDLLPSLPTENMVDGFLDLTKEKDQAVFGAFKFIFWIVVFALIIKYGLPVFNFLYPVAKRYSTTKFYRRFQSLISVPITFIVIFIILSLTITSVIFYSDYEDSKELAQEDIVHNAIEETKNHHIGFYENELKKNEKGAKAYIRSVSNIYSIPRSNFWPYSTKDISKASIQNALNNPNRYRWVYIDLMRTTAKEDIRFSKKYQDYFYGQKNLQKKLNAVYVASFGDSSYVQEKVSTRLDQWEKEKQKEFKEIYNGWKPINIAISALVVIIFFFTSRQDFGKEYEKFIGFLEQGRFGLGGSARFAGLLEEWPYNFKNHKNSLFMGRSLYNPFRHIGLKDERHMLTIAGSRAGKGATVIIPNLLLWEGSTLVIDPKGTNAAVTMRRRKEMGHDVHLIDPFDLLGKDDKASINPLEFLDPKSLHIREQINVIAEALVVPDENQKERHWDDGARTVIAGMIGHLISSGKYEEPNLSMLRDMISMLPEEQVELWADMSLNEQAGRLPIDAANRVIRGMNTNEISSIISNADKHTEWLSSPAMKKTLSKSSFKFSDLKEKPTTIYLILPPEYLQTHNRFLRLFINLVINQMSVGGKSKVPVLLLMDEFLALGRMEEVEKAFGLMAGYNLVLWPFVQDFGRLKDLYKKSVNAFIANSRAVQIFGVADEETKEFVSNHIGDRALETSMKIEHHRNIAKLRTSSEVAIDVAAHSGRQYILRSGKAPFVLEKVPYYDAAPVEWMKGTFGEKGITEGLFKGLYDPDPDYIKK